MTDLLHSVTFFVLQINLQFTDLVVRETSF